MSRILPLVCAFGIAASAHAQSPPPATLRVGLWTLWHDRELTVTSPPASKAELRACPACPPGPFTKPIVIRAANANQLQAGDRHMTSAFLDSTSGLTLAAHGETLTLHHPIHIAARNGELVLAVTLPVETYVERVVASESGPADSPESLKALAIVVRSFALHQPHGHADYDLCDSTHCQLLRWTASSAQHSAAHAATLATAGETLWFHGRRAAAWFHQNCGGRTASPAEVWPSPGRAPPMPWLLSHSDPYCTASGAREWSTTVSLADLTTALANAGLARPGWQNLTVAHRGESGRAVTLLAGPAEMHAEDFRLAVGRALGWGKILSTWFEVSRQDSPRGPQFVFHGRGSGHGVGLCQAGAAAMAAQNRSAAEILLQYFPGTTIADQATGHAWATLRSQGYLLETQTDADRSFLPQLSQALAEAQTRSGLQPAGTITIRAFPTVTAFREDTLAPGWVAAFTEGAWIGVQPLATLASRKLLAPVLRHEFLHALVESQAAPNAPLWLREGLVELWADGPAATSPAIKLDDLDAALARATTEADSESAHRAAAIYAKRLLDRVGREQSLAWLHSSLPASAANSIR